MGGPLLQPAVCLFLYVYKVKITRAFRKLDELIVGIEYSEDALTATLRRQHAEHGRTEIFVGRTIAEARSQVDERVRKLPREHGWGRYRKVRRPS